MSNLRLVTGFSKSFIVLVLGMIIGMHSSTLWAQDTIYKAVCLYSAPQADDIGSFNFNGDGHLYDVTYEAPSGLDIIPASPTTTSGESFSVHATTPGTYTVKINYTCVDPNCHDVGVGYVTFSFINCDSVQARLRYLISHPSFMGPDINDVQISIVDGTDPVKKTIYKIPQIFVSTGTTLAKVPPAQPNGTPSSDHVDTYGPFSIGDLLRHLILKWHRKLLFDPLTNSFSYHTIVIYDDGEIWDISDAEDPRKVGQIEPALIGGGILKLEGDDLYIATNSGALVSRDTGATWQIDTLGLGTVYVNDLALDTLQNVYLATSAGLFKQTPKGTTWNLLSGLPTGYIWKIFGSKENVLYASTNSGILISADEGSTWNFDSAGVAKYSTVVNFGEDAYGNIYAIENNPLSVSSLYKRTPGNPVWQNIQSGLAQYNSDSTIAHALHAIVGDSALYLATTFGLFQSTDQGTTWEPYGTGIQPQNFYGFAHDPQGNYYIGTNQGIFRGHPDDSDWTKLFPQNGYLNGSPIFRDNAGVLYGLAKNTPEPVRSTDQGNTWQLDTLGANSRGTMYYVDEAGTQYAGSQISPVQLFTKHAGQAWVEDDAGLPATSANTAGVLFIQSDGHGSVYLSTQINGVGGVWKRPIAGGTWTADSTGLQGKQVYNFARDRSGNLYGGTYANGLIVEKSGTWQSVTPPNLEGVNPSYSAFVVSVDSANTLTAAYGAFDASFNYRTTDMFYQRNGSSVWNAANIASGNCSGLIAVEDTTFLLTDRGLMSFSSSGVSSVQLSGPSPIFSATLVVQPNPTVGSAAISFALPEDGMYTLDISDVLGREKLKRQGRCTAGQQVHVQYDLSGWDNGTYYVRVEQDKEIRSVTLKLAR